MTEIAQHTLDTAHRAAAGLIKISTKRGFSEAEQAQIIQAATLICLLKNALSDAAGERAHVYLEAQIQRLDRQLQNPKRLTQ